MKEVQPAHILQQIAQIQRMEPGKLCVMGHGPSGPYYNLQCRENGRTLSSYVAADQVETVVGHTANYRKFQGLVAEYAQAVIDRTRQERATNAKKKTRFHRGSSWPKTKKSSG